MTGCVPVVCDSIDVEKTDAVCISWLVQLVLFPYSPGSRLVHGCCFHALCSAKGYHTGGNKASSVPFSSLQVTGTFFKTSHRCFYDGQKALKNVFFLSLSFFSSPERIPPFFEELHLVTSPLCLSVSHKSSCVSAPTWVPIPPQGALVSAESTHARFSADFYTL